MKPERLPNYRKFVRALPCAICSKTWGVEACHSGAHGIGQKSPDTSCIPLCAKHHRDSEVGLDRIGRAAFEDLHGVSVARIVKLTQRRAEACGVREYIPLPEKKAPQRVTISGLRGSRLAR